MLLAQEVNILPGEQFSSLGDITISSLISAGIQIVLVVAAVILVFILIGGGIAVMSSGGGNPQGQERGRQAITGALIGLIIIFGAWAIINLVNIFFGINILQLNIPTAQ